MATRTNDQDSFVQLEQMLKQVERNGLRSLSSDDLLLFGHLYRRTVSALSTARSQGVDDVQIEYLNHLATRAYGHIYVAEKKGWPSVPAFFTKEFPQTFRRNLPFILAAFLITLVSAMFAFGVVHRDPGTADTVLGPGSSLIIDEIASRHTGHRNWMPEEARPIMSTFIIVNNVKVSILAFAFGITLGLGTFAVLFKNGLMLGVIAGAIAHRGWDVSLGFWAFVAPHGVIELTAIFIAGGAGLMLGWALLSPGYRTRADALKLAGREAFKLMLGVAAMLVVAGLIEGFFSPSMLPESLKLTVAGVLFALEYGYFFLVGRSSRL